MNPVLALAQKWRTDADAYERDGALVRGEAVLRRAAHELEAAWDAWQSEELTIAQAAAEGGYSEEQLRRKVRDGELAAVRNGDRGHIRIRRHDVPRKLGHSRCQGDAGSPSDGYDVNEDARDIAERLGRQ
jgi:excisionase family DNA binding protein